MLSRAATCPWWLILVTLFFWILNNTSFMLIILMISVLVFFSEGNALDNSATLKTRLTFNYSNRLRLFSRLRRITIKHKTYECIWMMKRNERTCVEMKWGGKSKCSFLWCHSIFLNFLSFTAISISSQLISSISFHYLPFAIISRQYAVHVISLTAALFISFQFSSFHSISFPFEYIRLLYFQTFFLSNDWTV